MESYKKIINLGDQEITLETGKVARQATGAVLATCGNTQVLATVVVGKAPGEHQDFFPLTVNGKKSWCSPGAFPTTTVARTCVFPQVANTAPVACLATLPVSKVISWSPKFIIFL